MSKYLIHACNERIWYVRDYLIPSMIKQGIRREDIDVYLDKENDGNLISTMKSFRPLINDENTWHLQDDVVISSKFKEVTESDNYYNDIVCGFCSTFCAVSPIGKVTLEQMWFSFPCIRIPNKIAHDFSCWLSSILDDPKYSKYVKARKYDDTLFRGFLEEKYPYILCHNLHPNIVNHIDYLIGGSSVNNYIGEKVVSIYWEEDELVSNLEKELKKRYQKETEKKMNDNLDFNKVYEILGNIRQCNILKEEKRCSRNCDSCRLNVSNNRKIQVCTYVMSLMSEILAPLVNAEVKPKKKRSTAKKEENNEADKKTNKTTKGVSRKKEERN